MITTTSKTPLTMEAILDKDLHDSPTGREMLKMAKATVDKHIKDNLPVRRDTTIGMSQYDIASVYYGAICIGSFSGNKVVFTLPSNGKDTPQTYAEGIHEHRFYYASSETRKALQSAIQPVSVYHLVLTSSFIDIKDQPGKKQIANVTVYGLTLKDIEEVLAGAVSTIKDFTAKFQSKTPTSTPVLSPASFKIETTDRSKIEAGRSVPESYVFQAKHRLGIVYFRQPEYDRNGKLIANEAMGFADGEPKHRWHNAFATQEEALERTERFFKSLEAAEANAIKQAPEVEVMKKKYGVTLIDRTQIDGDKYRYVPRDFTHQIIHELGAVYLSFTKPYGAIGYSGRKSEQSWLYSYSSEFDMMKKVDDFFSRLESWEQSKKERKEDRKKESAQAKETVQVGAIYYSTGGYDQTNVDFFQVVEKKGGMIGIRKLHKAIAPGEHDRVLPVKDSFQSEEVLQKKVGNEIRLPESWGVGCLWDGNPKYETPSGYGH